MSPKPDRLGETEARLARASEAWLPAHDPETRARILAFLREIEDGGVDSIAALRDSTRRWFGPRAPSVVPAPRSVVTLVGSADIALENLTPTRHPTMWPQRPKRLTDELFSSWLWRTAVVAGVPPRRFARDVLGTIDDDVDRDVAPATVRRLAQRSGQTFEHLSGGMLSVSAASPQETAAGLVEDALLRDGRFLLCGSRSDRLGRPRPVVQYCPRCLESDARPHFRRGWRFAHVVVCTVHGCRLHDRCWACGAVITLLATRIIDAQPRCASCDAQLRQAHVDGARRVQPRQRALNAVLFYLAVRIATDERQVHLDALLRLFGGGRSSVVIRERSLIGLRASAQEPWFGAPLRLEHAAPLQMLSMGVTFSGLAEIAATRQRRARARAGAVAPPFPWPEAPSPLY
jgi:hypothetical protein